MICLAELPVEILHHILDYLNTETILFAVQYVCKQFYSIVKSYNNYNFNFESISKSNFHRICQWIPFEQVISLTLSDKDKTHGQIRLFLALFNINQFIRLRSLSLIQIEDEDLKVILNSIKHTSLNTLSIDSQTFSIRKNTALDLISSAIEYQTLRKLDLNMWFKDMKELQWPINCTINYLRIKNRITLNQFCLILDRSPCLQTIILKDFNIDEIDISTYVADTQFLQLKSLTFEDGCIQMTKLETCLSLTPELKHLKLIGNGNLVNSCFDGQRWEEIIRSKLPYLEKFEFFFSVLTDVHFDPDHVEQIISFFRTSFWLHEKPCFVISDYIIYLHKLILYSIPICNYQFEYHCNTDKVSARNFQEEHDNSIMMDNVKELHVCLSKFLTEDNIETINQPLFRNVTELTIEIDGEWPKDSFRFLSMTIDLLHLVKLSLAVNFSHQYMPSIVHGVNQFLKQAMNIHTLSVFDYLAPGNCTTNMETISEIVTSNIKHLHIRVKNSDDVKFIIENFEYLQSVTFGFPQHLLLCYEDFNDGLSDSKKQWSKWNCRFTLYLWLNNN